MNALGEKIPTAWIWLVPFVGTIYWQWKYSEGVEHVTKGKTSGVLAFVLLFLLGFIGQAIVQSEFNKIDATVAGGFAPGAPQPTIPSGAPAPDNSFGGPVTTTQPSPIPINPMPPQPITPTAPAPGSDVVQPSVRPGNIQPPSQQPPQIS